MGTRHQGWGLDTRGTYVHEYTTSLKGVDIEERAPDTEETAPLCPSSTLSMSYGSTLVLGEQMRVLFSSQTQLSLPLWPPLLTENGADSSSVGSSEVCWICLDETDKNLLQFCKCSSVAHQDCLQKWLFRVSWSPLHLHLVPSPPLPGPLSTFTWSPLHLHLVPSPPSPVLSIFTWSPLHLSSPSSPGPLSTFTCPLHLHLVPSLPSPVLSIFTWSPLHLRLVMLCVFSQSHAS